MVRYCLLLFVRIDVVLRTCVQTGSGTDRILRYTTYLNTGPVLEPSVLSWTIAQIMSLSLGRGSRTPATRGQRVLWKSNSNCCFMLFAANQFAIKWPPRTRVSTAESRQNFERNKNRSDLSRHLATGFELTTKKNVWTWRDVRRNDSRLIVTIVCFDVIAYSLRAKYALTYVDRD